MLKTINKKRIILTGGHAATTAIATVEEIIRRHPDWDINWIGVEKAIEGKNAPTLESQALPKLGVRKHNVITGKLQTSFTIWTIPSLAKIPIGFLHSIYLIYKIKPELILSFGGFAALPVVIVGKLFNVPTILHEQTAASGRANRITAIFADKICLARGSSETYFPKHKSLVVGNPVMTQITEVEPKTRLSDPPALYVLGGSRGSQAINELISPILRKLLREFVVIHIAGIVDYKKMLSIKRKLPKDLADKYDLFANIDPLKIDNIYRQADIVVARAGANTVSEILITKRPSILIPLPIAYQDEQTENARLAEKFGVAKVLYQKNLSSKKLYKEIKKVEDDWTNIVTKVKGKKSTDRGAASRLVNVLEDYV